MTGPGECDEIEHERALREQWQEAHENVHRLEDEARELAARVINIRLEGMNELRRQIDSERGVYISREVHDQQINALREATDTRLKSLENAKSNLEGRLWMIGIAIGAVVTLVQLALYWLTHK